MERLTETGKIFTFPKTDSAENAYLERVQKRLAAYEDTGLEPEEIKDILDRYLGFRAAISDETGQPMVSWTRASKLVRADKEGRVVVLPCRVGDVVYALGYQSIRELTICSCTRIGCCAEDENGKLDYLGYEVFGKTVFLTRAEAEAAIGGGQT